MLCRAQGSRDGISSSVQLEYHPGRGARKPQSTNPPRCQYLILYGCCHIAAIETVVYFDKVAFTHFSHHLHLLSVQSVPLNISEKHIFQKDDVKSEISKTEKRAEDPVNKIDTTRRYRSNVCNEGDGDDEEDELDE